VRFRSLGRGASRVGLVAVVTSGARTAYNCDEYRCSRIPVFAQAHLDY
jgi:hypothetical protein